MLKFLVNPKGFGFGVFTNPLYPMRKHRYLMNFGAFRIVIILTYGRGAVSNKTGATRKRGVNDKATVNTPDRQSPWRFNFFTKGIIIWRF